MKPCSGNNNIPSGLYNISNNDKYKLNEIVKMISKSNNKRIAFLKINKNLSIIYLN